MTTWNCAVFDTYEKAMNYVEQNAGVFAGRRFYKRSPKPLKDQEKNLVGNPNKMQQRSNPQGRMRVRSLDDVTGNVPKKGGLFPCQDNLGCEDEELKWVLYWEDDATAN